LFLLPRGISMKTSNSIALSPPFRGVLHER
jgi:hypothetical protein